ncbi:transcriptional initiation protein Tat [Aeromonas cavernicola]|uniref:Transcriptional initiation protein Tat n=1 Tax=Aeromonas cavernicola TaxID=1006623 RepID=A0A2H9U1V9_9GAMM|nr:transcriptional initiation protein Tat [Aeromonas cavernicola]PJG58057.1 transcriptional initiation protein Tat [Aeromonas cavernicola]
MSNDKLQNPARRQLIKGVGVATTLGVLAGATGRVVAKEGPASELNPNQSEAQQGYRDTPHVHDFYRTLRGTD